MQNREFDRFRVYIRTFSKGWVCLLMTTEKDAVMRSIEVLDPNDYDRYIVVGHYDDINCDVPYLSGSPRPTKKRKL